MIPISILGDPTETMPPAGTVAPSIDVQNGNGSGMGHSTNGHAGDEQTALALRHQSSSSNELFTSLKFFESIEELQDIAVGLAFAEKDEEEIVAELEALHKNRSDDLVNQHKALEEFQRFRIRITRGRIDHETAALEEARRKALALEAEDKGLKEQGQSVSKEINLTLRQLKQVRLQHEKKFFDEEIGRLQNKQQLKEAGDAVNEQFAFAETIYNLKKRQYELNRPEFQRVADDADRERASVEAQQKEIRGRLERFQRLGVSKTTAGFLVHAGYASFAAVGALIAGFFHARQGGGGDFLSRIVGGIRSLIGLSQGGWAIWSPLLNLVLLIGAAIAVVSVTTLVMNWLIGTLDRNWPKRAARQRRTEGKGFVDLMKYAGSWVGSFFQSERNKQQSRGRSNKDDSAQLDRGAFVQLLAHMPFIIGAALVFFFFAGLGIGTDGQPGNLPKPLEISSTYIGVIFLTLSTSAAILYVTNVIEPRWQRNEVRRRLTAPDNADDDAPNQGAPLPPNDDRSGFIDTLKLNWEFVVLVLALVFSLAMTSLLPVGDPYNRWALGSVAIFMSLASLGLAYGLIQRGLFKDFDVMERHRQELLDKADACNQLPTIEAVFENFDNKEIGDKFREGRSTQRKLDDLRVLYELNRIFGPDFEDNDKFQAFLAQFVPSDVSLEGMKRAARTIDPLDGQVPVPDEKLQAFYSQQERRGHLDIQIDANREELNKLRSHADELNGDLDRLYKELLDQELRIVELKREFCERRQQLEINHKKEILWLKSAYRIGNTAYRLTQPRPKELPAAS